MWRFLQQQLFSEESCTAVPEISMKSFSKPTKQNMEVPQNTAVQSDESYAVFYLDGEPCGPRTELWSGYVENNEEVSFVGGMSLWVRFVKN
jgi:hypothetical protein